MTADRTAARPWSTSKPKPADCGLSMPARMLQIRGVVDEVQPSGVTW